MNKASEDFKKQLDGYGLTTAQILYRLPDHPHLLQTFVWQEYDLFPAISDAVALPRILDARTGRPAAFGDGRACAADQAVGVPGGAGRVFVELAQPPSFPRVCAPGREQIALEIPRARGMPRAPEAHHGSLHER
jgi:hypothetical protein